MLFCLPDFLFSPVFTSLYVSSHFSLKNWSPVYCWSLFTCTRGSHHVLMLTSNKNSAPLLFLLWMLLVRAPWCFQPSKNQSILTSLYWDTTAGTPFWRPFHLYLSQETIIHPIHLTSNTHKCIITSKPSKDLSHTLDVTNLSHLEKCHCFQIPGRGKKGNKNIFNCFLPLLKFWPCYWFLLLAALTPQFNTLLSAKNKVLGIPRCSSI